MHTSSPVAAFNEARLQPLKIVVFTTNKIKSLIKKSQAIFRYSVCQNFKKSSQYFASLESNRLVSSFFAVQFCFGEQQKNG